MLKKINSRYLNFENLRKSQGDEAVTIKLKNQKRNKNRSYSISSNSSNESTKSNINSRVYDGSISYADILKGI